MTPVTIDAFVLTPSIERRVPSRAVQYGLADRVLPNGLKTVACTD